MYTQQIKPVSLTSRVNKSHSSLNNSQQRLSIPLQDQILSNHHHSHRKYKLSHSQVEKLSKEGLNRWREKMENKRCMTIGNIENSKINQYNNEQFSQISEKIPQSSNDKHTDYHIENQINYKISQSIDFHCQLIKFCFPKINNPSKQVIEQNTYKSNQIHVITFQIHDKEINTHFRAEYIYEQLNEQIKLIFQSVEQLFNYIYSSIKQFNKNIKSSTLNFFNFNKRTLQLKLKIFLQGTYDKNQIDRPLKTKQKYLKILLSPHAVIEILEDHHVVDQHLSQQKMVNMQKQLNEFNSKLRQKQQQIKKLNQENLYLKSQLNQQIDRIEKEKAQKELLLQNFQKLSKTSQISKEYQFQFIPDPKAKNYTNFIYKNNIIKKTKNDLKWDQISSQSPLPKAGKHYFSFYIQNYNPDFMFGIVTIKGKDTLNAFLGLQTICLYVSKNNCFIYERSKHYKISCNIREKDTVYVIVDLEKGMIQWKRKRESNQGQTNEKQQQNDLSKTTRSIIDHRHESLENISQTTIVKKRKGSQQNSTLQNHLTHTSSQLLLNPLLSATIQQIDYIHSVKLPQQMKNHDLYGYLQIYNINQSLKLNIKK